MSADDARDDEASGLIRTVSGDIRATELGSTNYHEHLFQTSPLLPGDDLDDEVLSQREATSLHESGFAAMIDATPIGLGRRPDALRRISSYTGLRIVATTGVHKQEHYPNGHWVREMTEEQLASRMTDEITTGMPLTDLGPETSSESGVRAGMIKVGIGYWRISPFERRAISAAGTAHRQTGAPVMVHLEHGSAGMEVLDALRGVGVPSDSVVLAHVDRNPDPYLHADLADVGAYLGYDGFARHREWPDSTVMDCIVAAAAAGAADRIVVGGDVARRTRYRAYGGMPGLSYLGERILPRLTKWAGEADVRRFLVRNPARLLGRVRVG